MSSKITIKDSGPAFKSLSSIIKAISSKKVVIGIFGKDDSKILMIARVHEYGIDIDVTDAMRGYLHSIGIHLKSTTTQIKIPERSFMRAGFDSKKKQFEAFIKRLIPLVLKKEIKVETFFNTIGNHIVSELQEYLRDLSDPPLSDLTVQKTGRSNPLVHKGNLLQSIKFEVR